MLSRRLLNSKFKHYFDEVLPLLVSTTTGLFLYARVRVGQCDNLKDIWHTQSCNPVADCLSIPHDQVLLTYMTPLIFQLVMKGVRFRMIILSWAVSTMFITISIVFARAWPQVWTIFYSFLFLFVLIESERLMRISFLQNKIVVHHESNRTALVETARQHARAIKKSRYELHIVALQAEKDKHEIENERARLRSLIGNVAHDLKTPLQSIGES